MYPERVQHQGSKTQDCHSHCHDSGQKRDYLLWVTGLLIALCYLVEWLPDSVLSQKIVDFAEYTMDLMGKMAWGLIFAIIFVGIMDFIPRAKMNQILGTNKGVQGILRATLAGVVLDLCSHGILLVGMKLYERGASLGQVIAFLVASPWNSISMTFILWSLIGLKLTLLFILFSAVIAIVSGIIFDVLVTRQVLPAHHSPMKPEEMLSGKVPWFEFNGLNFMGIAKKAIVAGFTESKMILRWIFFGVLLTALVKILITPDTFQHIFGPDVFGVVMTLAVATVLEVCSEGSSPLAAEIVKTAGAPGNGFTFLMAGVATDYTEILALKETTRSWKIAFFLPLITLPQVIVIGVILNYFG